MVKNSIQKDDSTEKAWKKSANFQTVVGAGGDAECFCGQKISALQLEQLETRQQYTVHSTDAASLVLWSKGHERQPGLIISHVQKRKGRSRIIVRWHCE